jgi:ABC-type transport system involved in cytochrome c biogenesis permease subunit
MPTVENAAFTAALGCLFLAAVFYLWQFLTHRSPEAESAPGAKARSFTTPASVWPGRLALIFSALALGTLTLSLAARAAVTGHGPFSNMYEFTVAFSWGAMALGIYFQQRYRLALVSLIVFGVALALLIYAFTLPTRPVPLVPALQQSWLLTAHVLVAIIAYGTFAVGFGAAHLYLLRRPGSIHLPRAEMLDEIGYRSVMIGFPFMTLTIVLGAFWADIAWGRYWSWDPKETASLVTWLIYAAFLHARVVRGWRGKRSAVFLIVGFAAVLFTFLGNYIFTGLHSYR